MRKGRGAGFGRHPPMCNVLNALQVWKKALGLTQKGVLLCFCRDRSEHGEKSVAVTRSLKRMPHGSRREQQGANKASVDMIQHEFMSAAHWLFQDTNAGGFYAIDKSDIYGRRWYKTEEGIEFLRRSSTLPPSIPHSPPLALPLSPIPSRSMASCLSPAPWFSLSPSLSLSHAKFPSKNKVLQRNTPASLVIPSSSILEPSFRIGPVLTPQSQEEKLGRVHVNQ